MSDSTTDVPTAPSFPPPREIAQPVVPGGPLTPSSVFLRPGGDTSEFQVATRAQYIGAAMVALGAALPALRQYLPDSKWMSLALVGFGALKALLSSMNYVNGRNDLKAQLMKFDG